MKLLKRKFVKNSGALKERVQALLEKNGDKVIGEVTIKQAYGGMRGIRGLVCDTSEVPPDKGLIVRGIPISELTEKLPEEVYFLLLTGELPTQDESREIHTELVTRRGVPAYVWDILSAMPKDTHAMTMFNTAILAMQRESLFSKRYAEGMAKNDYWQAALEDSLNLIARLPELGAGIYRMKYNKGDRIPSNAALDWAADYAHMLGLPDSKGEVKELMRLYMTLHCDHEGGNVSAFSAQVVGSALSDIYYTLCAGLNGLAGPLHGLANQECLGWILDVLKEFDGKTLTEDQVRDFAWKMLRCGKVIPGYGHAVLRVTDPRFEAFLAFGNTHIQNDPVFELVRTIRKVVPEILTEQGKASNPYPNVDAGSGCILYHYGLKEFDYYTVLFSISRALGISAQMIMNRALHAPITRPKSVTTQWMEKQSNF